jgi:hypothetical protein
MTFNEDAPPSWFAVLRAPGPLSSFSNTWQRPDPATALCLLVFLALLLSPIWLF